MSSLHNTPRAPAGSSQEKKKRAVQRPDSATPASARKRTGTKGNTTSSARDTPEQPHVPDPDTIERMVAEAAYYLAEKRNFAAGYDEEDWLAARDQIVAQLQAATNPLRRNEHRTRLSETGVDAPAGTVARARRARPAGRTALRRVEPE